MGTGISTLKDFLQRISAHPASPLVFVNGDDDIKPGYHVTELKSVAVRSVDCGGRQAAWRETVVQLLDGPYEAAGPRMSAAKFAKIAEAGLRSLPELQDGELYFEYAPDNRAMQKLSARAIVGADDQTVVTLASHAAVCKPAEERAAAAADRESSGCCGSAASTSACCTI